MKKYLLAVLSSIILSFSGMAQCTTMVTPTAYATQMGTICTGGIAQFSINYYGGGTAPTFNLYSYYNNGTGIKMLPSQYNLIGASGPQPLLMIMDSNIQSFTLEMISSDPCASPAKSTAPIFIKRLPIVYINNPNNSSATVCTSDAFILSTTPYKNSAYAKYMFPGLTYSNFSWYKDGKVIPGATDSAYTPTSSGQYYMQYYYTDNNGSNPCNTYYYTVNIVTCSPFSTSITGTNPITTGAQNSVYSVPDQTGLTYVWNVTGGAIGSGQNTHSVIVNWDASASTHSISVTETNAAAETNTTTLNITTTGNTGCTTPLPAPKINSGDVTICSSAGGFIYSATISSGTSLQWKLNGNPITNATHSTYAASESGTYTIEENDGVCPTRTSDPSQLTIVPTPIANAGADQHVRLNDVVALQASEGQSYSWSPSTGLSSTTISNPTLLAENTITYAVTVTNTDIAKSIMCMNTASVTIFVDNATAITTSFAQSGIQFYPNPSTDAFNIVMPQSGTLVNYTITDLAGTAVASGAFTSTGGAEKITTNFNTGLYQVVLKYNETVTFLRLNKVQ